MSFSEWDTSRIEDICRIRRGSSPRPIQEYLSDIGIPWVKISDATASNSRYISKTKEFIKEEGRKHSRPVQRGTMILSNSATPGIPKIMDIDACVHDGWLIVDEFNNVVQEYLYYVFINEREKLLNLSNGSVFRNLKTDIVKGYEIYLPPLQEQKAIAHILSTLDEKIEANNRINKTLEEMAQAIFKHWFMDFEFPNEDGEPYKSSGGEMVPSELGPIPKGWEVGTLQDLGDIVGGGTPSRKKEEYFVSKGIPWITPKDLSNNKNKYIYKGENDISELGLKNSSAKIVPKGTVLFSSRAPIGYIAVAAVDVTTNQGFKSIVPREIYGSEYVYQEMRNKTELISNRASGSTFKEISGSGLKSIETVLPSKELVREFNTIVNPLSNKIKANEKEIDALTEIRDTLLPKLMSGEIRVPLDNKE